MKTPHQRRSFASSTLYLPSLFLLAAASLSGGCGQGPAAPPAQTGGAQARAGATPSEVVIIATQHMISDMPEGFTPGHLRALLAKIKPDVVAVEAPTNVPDPWFLGPLELMKITKPWAEEHKTQLAPAGWFASTYQIELTAMFQDFQKQGKAAAYQDIEQAFQLSSAQQPMTCAFMNSAAYHDLWRSYHQKLHDLYDRDTPWETWNAKIVANVEKICREHPGGRVAVVFGAAHGYYLADRLGENAEVTVVDPAKFFPLSEEEVAANTTKKDYLLSLRPLNFLVVAPQQFSHLAAALEQIKDVAELERDYHLFHGKLLLHQGQFAAAQEEFSRVAETAGDAITAFDGLSRLREPALVYVAITKGKLGQLADARHDLDAVLAMPETNPDTRQWIEQLKAELAIGEKAAGEQSQDREAASPLPSGEG